MKTKFNARALAWLLSICMIVGIIPAMPVEFAQAADSDVLTYIFTNVGANGTYLTDNTGTGYGTGSHPDNVPLFTYDYVAEKQPTSAPWSIAGATKSGDHLNNSRILIGGTGIFFFAKGHATTPRWNEAQIYIKVDSTGYYKPYINNTQTYPASCEVKVSMHNVDAQTRAFTENAIYTKTGVAPSTTGLGNDLGGKVYLEADKEYGIKIRFTTVGTANNPDLYLKSISLEKDSIESEISSLTTLAINATAQSTFGVKFDDAASISVANSNDEAVSVSNNNGTYTFTALSAGTAKITVTGTYSDDSTKSIAKDYYITVRPTAPADGSRVYYFSGVIDQSLGLCTANNKNYADANRFAIANSYITYDKTAAQLSAPWKIYSVYRSSIDDNKTVILNPDNIQIKNTGSYGTTLYVNVQHTSAAGWYTVKTDAEATGANASYKLRVFTGGALANDNLAYAKEGTSDVYDIDKPIYLRGNESCFLFEVAKGEADVKLKSLTLTPVSEADVEVEPSSAVASEYAAGAAATQVSFNVGAMAPSAVTAVSSNDAVMTAAFSGNTVTLTPVAAGTADITVTATYNSKEYTKKYSVTVSGNAGIVTGTPDAASPFASKYAYIEENKDGTFNVTFIGGINKLEGYSAVGFEIDVAGDKKYSDSANVYTSLDVNGSKYTAADNYSASYIFIGSRSGIAAGSKVVAKPYVVVDGEKKFLANAELTLQF